MKKILKLSAIIGCFMMLASTTTYSQDWVKNGTACDFVVKVAYGDLATCTVWGYDQMTVPAGMSMQFPNTNGADILYGKGVPVGTNCVFYVALNGCAPYSDTDAVGCGTGCNDYVAELVQGAAIYLQ